MSRQRGVSGWQINEASTAGTPAELTCWQQARVLRCQGWAGRTLVRRGGYSDLKGGGGLSTLTAGFLLKLGQAVQRQSPRMRLVEKRAQRSFWSLVKERERALVRYKPSLAGPASPPPPGTIRCPVSTFPGDRSEAFQLGPSTLTVTEPNESSRPHAVEWVCWPQGRGERKGSVHCRRGVQAAGA